MAKSEFLKRYTEEMTDILQNLHPEFTPELIKETVKEMVKEQMENPEVILDNNYTNEQKTTTLLSVFDWAYDRKPLIAGNGTFYMNQHEALNPIANMLKGMLSRRKAFKKQMFTIEDTESDGYKDLDRKQQVEKINVNSYYGASGAPSSAFYSKWSGPATTNTAQQVISTCENLFESFLVDNYNFIDLDELLHWCETVKEQEEDIEIDDFVILQTEESLFDRLYNKLIEVGPYDEEILKLYISRMSVSERTILYYKNNLIQFLKDHRKPRDIIIRILTNVRNFNIVDPKDPNWMDFVDSMFKSDYTKDDAKKWNKFAEHEYFMNPNSVPDEIKDDVQLLCNMLKKYIYVRYMAFDRVYRLKNFKREVVTVIDTDSNILSLDTVINYILDDIVKGQTFGRDKEKNVFILVNTITYTLTDIVNDILLSYGEYSNVPEEYRSIYNMKNEFYFAMLVIGLTKKRYISKIILREGNFMNPPKLDIKGFDFKKATCSEYAEKVFMGIIQKRIIDADEISVSAIYKDYKNFGNEIMESLKNKERKFLPNGNVKDISAYKDPTKPQSIRAFLAWNIIYPDNAIEAPAKVSLLKMNLFTEESCEPLKETHPDIYERIMDGIFNDTTGFFVKKQWETDLVTYVNVKDKNWFEKIPKKYRTKYKKLGPVAWNKFVDTYDGPQEKGHFEVTKKGLQVLAIPSNSEIPEWCIPYIDYDTVVNSILSPFNPILELMKAQFNEVGKTRNGVSRKSKSLSNIVKF